MEQGERRGAARQQEESPERVCAAMLGSLGLFGNSLIQLAASIALAQPLALTVPQRFQRRFGCLFVGGAGADADADAEDSNRSSSSYRWRTIPDAEAWSLPIVADRVVLSHPGFRAWMATREPYISLAAAHGGGGALSGRQLRRLFPQAAAADVAAAPSAAADAAGGSVQDRPAARPARRPRPLGLVSVAHRHAGPVGVAAARGRLWRRGAGGAGAAAAAGAGGPAAAAPRPRVRPGRRRRCLGGDGILRRQKAARRRGRARAARRLRRHRLP